MLNNFLFVCYTSSSVLFSFFFENILSISFASITVFLLGLFVDTYKYIFIEIKIRLKQNQTASHSICSSLQQRLQLKRWSDCQCKSIINFRTRRGALLEVLVQNKDGQIHFTSLSFFAILTTYFCYSKHAFYLCYIYRYITRKIMTRVEFICIIMKEQKEMDKKRQRIEQQRKQERQGRRYWCYAVYNNPNSQREKIIRNGNFIN